MERNIRLGTIVNNKKIDIPSKKACKDFPLVLAIFIRDYLYKYIEQDTKIYPLWYNSLEEWHNKIKAVTHNFDVLANQHILQEAEDNLTDSSFVLFDKYLSKDNDVTEQLIDSLNEGLDGLRDIYFELQTQE